jgi:hypothetical protein
MIKKALIAFVVFFLLLEGLLRTDLLNDEWLRSGQNNWSINILNSQNYLYKYDLPHFNCMIGSSISARFNIVKEMFPPEIFMLPFNGLSVHDGLNMLYRKDRLPDTLYVETNVLDRPANEEFASTIGSNKWEEKLKYYVTSLREAHGPLDLASQVTTSAIIVFRKKFGFTGGVLPNKVAMDKVREIEVEKQKQERKKQSQDEGFALKTNDLEKEFWSQMDNLHQKGVVIVLFNMPVDCRNEKGDIYYNNLYAKAKSKGFLVFDRAHCQDYTTTDGTHLSGNEIERYAQFFLDQRAKLKASVVNKQ